MISLNERISLLENGNGSTTSDVYAFKASSNLNANQNFNSGNIAQYNFLDFCVPSSTAYDTATYSYTVQKDGIYNFTYKLYCQTSSTSAARFGIYKNNGLVAISGQFVGNIETATLLMNCVVGDYVSIKCLFGSNISCMMSNQHSWFQGYLLK